MSNSNDSSKISFRNSNYSLANSSGNSDFINHSAINDTPKQKKNDPITELIEFNERNEGKYLYRGTIESYKLVPTLFRQENKIISGPETKMKIDKRIEELFGLERSIYKPTLELMVWEDLLLNTLKNESWVHGIIVGKDTPKENLNDVWKSVRPVSKLDDETCSYFALGRHYGLPTRMLDWTRNPLVALYFAAIESLRNSNQKMIIWFVEKTKFENMKIDDLYKVNNEVDIKLYVPSGISNPNAAVQESVLSIPEIVNMDKLSLEELGKGLEESNLFQGISEKIEIEGIKANGILRKLSYSYRTDAKVLFPGTEGFIKFINESQYY